MKMPVVLPEPTGPRSSRRTARSRILVLNELVDRVHCGVKSPARWVVDDYKRRISGTSGTPNLAHYSRLIWMLKPLVCPPATASLLS
jgi:hypothetical protein